VEAGHHEVAPGQHEIDFRYTEALETADNLATFRFIVRNVAYRTASWRPSCPSRSSGSTARACTPTRSLFKGGKNAFHDRRANGKLSDVAVRYIAGLLKHARGFCAITNPL